ncbi:hypothetical protein [Sphingomonas sp. MA1305]|uniref:hypothetical protein n=1 Tax=Sphingomonas sp. MA1305 TaxID=2479204 RepID=UPI0018DFF161|nr:hypothetical protein [Sphingomonas sp. MA1305]
MEQLVNRVGLNPMFDYDGVVDAPDDLAGQEVVVWREAVEGLIAANQKLGNGSAASHAGQPSPSANTAITTEPLNTDRTGGPGRPTSKHLYLAEMQRRSDNGQLADTLAGEVKALINWFDAQPNFSGLARMTERALQNAARNPYRGLKAIK